MLAEGFSIKPNILRREDVFSSYPISFRERGRGEGETCITMKRILIFANGELPDIEKARSILRDDDYIICADGGTRHASSLDLKPALIIGDMDSAESSLLQKLGADGVPIERYSRDKNETDLELAINKAVELNPKEIVIVAALGGRLDQTLANIALLTDLDSRISTFDSTMGRRRYSFVGIRLKLKGEAVTSSPSSHGAVKLLASKLQILSGSYPTKLFTLKKHAASATK